MGGAGTTRSAAGPQTTSSTERTATTTSTAARAPTFALRARGPARSSTARSGNQARAHETRRGLEARVVHARVERTGQRRRPEGETSPLWIGDAVERRSLAWGTADCPDHVLHPFRRHLLPVGCAGGTGDRLVHQRAAEVVRAGIESRLGAAQAELDPRGLHVRDPGMECESSHCVHEQRLSECGAGAGKPLQEDRRLHVDERKRNELGEAAGALLLVAEMKQVASPAARRVGMAEHDRGGRAEPGSVGRVVDAKPLARADLVRADDAADPVVEDLGCGSGKRGEAGDAESLEVVLQAEAEGCCALPDLERRERVDVKVGERTLDRRTDVEVEVAGESGVDAALETDLDGAPVPGLTGAADDLVYGNEVRTAPEVLRQLPLRECAEAATEVAHVRVVDVAGDDVGDRVPVHLAAEGVRSAHDCGEVRSARAEELDDVSFLELDPVVHFRQRLVDEL